MNRTAPPLLAEPDDLASRLRQLAQGRGTLDVAQFRFVGLDEVRSAYGERWAEQKARIQETAERFLRSRMDASDLLISAGGGFVIVFGSAIGVEATVATGQLSHGLNEFFLGDSENIPAPRVAASSHSAPIRELEESLSGAAFVKPEATPSAAEPPGLSELEWRYQPVWDVRRETLSNWYVSPYGKRTRMRLPGYQFENVPTQARLLAAVDEACLHVSDEAIKELISRGMQSLIGVSIHARTLTNVSTQARILSLLDRLDPELRRYRVVKIASVAPGFPRLYLNEIVQLLKKTAGNVVIGATWDEPDLAGLLRAAPVALGVALPMTVVGPAATVPFQALMLKLHQDVQRAHAAKVRFFVEGDIPPAIALKLAAAGVDNISSPRIWPARGMPDAMLRWPAARLTA